jgi:hypothetical protein
MVVPVPTWLTLPLPESIAFGLLVLSVCVALGGDNDPVDTQVAKPAEHQGEHKLGTSIEGPDEQQDKRQHKSQIGSRSPAMPGSDAGSPPDLQASDLRDSVCLMIESAARAHDLPREFFARVIWQESRFRTDTVGPRRRNGESAQGIAQFMPSKIDERS